MRPDRVMCGRTDSGIGAEVTGFGPEAPGGVRRDLARRGCRIAGFSRDAAIAWCRVTGAAKR
jgi:hypothetical protein